MPSKVVIVQNQKSPRFYELDLLRFIAALAVVLFHYTFIFVVENRDGSGLDLPLLKSIFKYGYLGVNFFFMLSGFVILLTALNKSWQGFFVSRVVRLFPAFWVALTITTVAILLLDDRDVVSVLSQYLWNLTMIPEYLGVPNIDSVYWTLQIEIKFYFWIFVILLFNKIRYIEGILFVWLLISFVDMFHFKHNYSHYLFIPLWAPYFTAGALFYIIKMKGLSVKRVALLVLSFVLSLYLAIEEVEDKIVNYNVDYSLLVVSFLILSFFLIFAFVIRKKDSSRETPAYRRCRTWCATLGGISYPLYLLHSKFGELLLMKFSGANKYLLLFLITGFMITVSFVLYRYIEKIIALKMKRKLETIL